VGGLGRRAAKRWSLMTACPVDIWTELDNVNECVLASVNNSVDIDTPTSGLPRPRINEWRNISISLLDRQTNGAKFWQVDHFVPLESFTLPGELIHVTGLFGLINDGSVCVLSSAHFLPS